jgi:hypothetical protein
LLFHIDTLYHFLIDQKGAAGCGSEMIPYINMAVKSNDRRVEYLTNQGTGRIAAPRPRGHSGWYVEPTRDQQGQRRTTRRIVSTAAAAAMLPHSKHRDTRMMCGQGNQSNERFSCALCASVVHLTNRGARRIAAPRPRGHSGWYVEPTRDQQGQRRTTHRIVSTAAAAAWLPHSKHRDTRMMCGQGNQSNERFSGALCVSVVHLTNQGTGRIAAPRPG